MGSVSAILHFMLTVSVGRVRALAKSVLCPQSYALRSQSVWEGLEP